MTEPLDPELMDLATPYALHAVTPDERDEIERRLAAAPPEVARAFADEVRAVRETMAVVSSGTAAEPPDHLRDRLLAEVTPNVRELRPKASRWRTAVLAAAAALVVGLGALGVGLALRPPATPSTAEQVFAAPDVRTVSGELPTGGTATVVFSREKNAGVLVMNNVDPPAPGTVYQMWLLRDGSPESAGTMDAEDVAPSTTAVLPDLGDSSALAFTVEPGDGSERPTTPIIAELPLA
ncbi:anti-sigma factor [Mycobacterium hubeiense]|uniref:anti-sigma factor n=1 Tax=Mycobacterium hubeiense TaxID=1867256 RepID=UPI000C7F671D|nr:anti-sigma factor [Mycobacterium sp. QGD 101]